MRGIWREVTESNWKQRLVYIILGLACLLGLLLMWAGMRGAFDNKGFETKGSLFRSQNPECVPDTKKESEELAVKYAAKIQELSSLPISYDRKEDRMKEIMADFEHDKTVMHIEAKRRQCSGR